MATIICERYECFDYEKVIRYLAANIMEIHTTPIPFLVKTFYQLVTKYFLQLYKQVEDFHSK